MNIITTKTIIYCTKKAVRTGYFCRYLEIASIICSVISVFLMKNNCTVKGPWMGLFATVLAIIDGIEVGNSFVNGKKSPHCSANLLLRIIEVVMIAVVIAHLQSLPYYC